MKVEADRTEYFLAGVSLSRHEPPQLRGTLEEVAAMKVLCGLLFIERARGMIAREVVKKEERQSADKEPE